MNKEDRLILEWLRSIAIFGLDLDKKDTREVRRLLKETNEVLEPTKSKEKGYEKSLT